MATIEDAVKEGVLEIYTLPSWERRPPIRQAYVVPDLFSWVDSKPELYDRALAVGGRLLVDHLEQMFCDLRCARHPLAGDIRRMNPTRKGIWKMHPPGLRVYGWFPDPDAFAAVAAALESETKKDKGLNDEKRDEVSAFLRTHKLEKTVVIGDRRAIFPQGR